MILPVFGLACEGYFRNFDPKIPVHSPVADVAPNLSSLVPSQNPKPETSSIEEFNLAFKPFRHNQLQTPFTTLSIEFPLWLHRRKTIKTNQFAASKFSGISFLSLEIIVFDRGGGAHSKTPWVKFRMNITCLFMIVEFVQGRETWRTRIAEIQRSS